MHGIAMPVSTPYVLRASLPVIPKSFRQAGIEAASTLCSRVTAARLAVRGADRPKSSLTVPDSEGRDGIRPKGFWAASRRAEKRAAMNSPATIPAAASWIEGICPLFCMKIKRRSIKRMRPVCSMSWLNAGSLVCWMPKLYPQMQLWTAEQGSA